MLKHMCQLRQAEPPARRLQESVREFMRGRVIPRQKKLTQLAQAWTELLPEEIQEHTCLEDFKGGQLKVLVDSASHLAELNILIREGLLDELRQLCPGIPLSKVKLARGQWYSIDEDGNRVPYYK
ncbi:MAG: DUF721 domain-containing protein [Sedimentisphaerales bacterium]|nr:DUF721 domain-containing protein [Sedimentisphaerales bacterium]